MLKLLSLLCLATVFLVPDTNYDELQNTQRIECDMKSVVEIDDFCCIPCKIIDTEEVFFSCYPKSEMELEYSRQMLKKRWNYK